MPGPVVFLFALAFVAFEGSLLQLIGIEQFTFQFGLAAIVVIALTRKFVVGGLIVSLLLVPIEWSVSGVPGYYAFAAVGLFLILQPLRGRIRLGVVEAALVGGASALVQGLGMLVTLALTKPTSPVIAAIVSNVVVSVFTVAFSTVVMAYLFKILDHRFKPVRGNQLELDV